jgi:nickel superoxide dismutase
MLKQAIAQIKRWFPAPEVSAHCDGPCGVYDPASARIAAEAVVSLTNKILKLDPPQGNDQASLANYHNTLARYIQIKEEQAEITKREILILWTDYFKPKHLERYPDLHDKVWKATKLCSTCKQNIDPDSANQLMDYVKEIHDIFWTTKERNDVVWYKAS